MYPSIFQEDMPCGLGFEWVVKDGYRVKRLMTNKQISLEQIEWLGYMESDKRFMNKDGGRCKLVHGWNNEEVKVDNYSLDGFCEVDDKKYALEFNGCYWHGCKKCGKPGIQTVKIIDIINSPYKICIYIIYIIYIIY